MPQKQRRLFARVRKTAVLAAVMTFIAIITLGATVARELRVFEDQSMESAQWSLAQTEIEFLEFTNLLNGSDPNLKNLRRRFDVFYSRVGILENARTFEGMRADPQFASTLDQLKAFRDTVSETIDADDAALRAALPELRETAQDTRQHVRRLALSGLELFTRSEDAQRVSVANTTLQLGAATVALFGGLAFALFSLDRTNQRATDRGKALEQSVSRINTIITASLDGVIVTDAAGFITEFSPAAEEIFGRTASDARGLDIGDLITLSDDPKDAGRAGITLIVNFDLVRQGRIRRDCERLDGTRFPAEIAIQTAVTDQGAIYIVFIRDISRRMNAEKELVAARDAALASERIKTDFLATMSHEIRTPLNGLLGNMDLLRDTALNLPQERYLQNMETSGRMLMRHISDVLDITRYDAGKLKITNRIMHLPTLVDDIIATQIGLATSQRTNLTWQWEGESVDWVKSDPDRLQHILMNLIGNAVKFTKDGSVQVRVSKYDDQRQARLRFVIADTGPGIDEAILPNIFDDFVTGDTRYDREVGGTGLGLSIAKRFAKGLGGDLGVTSQIGVGTEFSLDIPITISKSPQRPTKQKTLPPIDTQNILVVEDNGINRAVVREMLEADGHHVTDAKNGEAGVARAFETAFDLILMDISMPVMDGREAARQIRNGGGASSETPIVALTANAMVEDQARFMEAGMIATITKPLTRPALRMVMRELNTPVTPPREALINAAHLRETQDTLGPASATQMSFRFATEVAEFIDWLDTSPLPALPRIAERAHQIAGSAAMFGAAALRTALIDLEDTARDANAIRVSKFPPVLKALWAETETALNESNPQQA